MPDDGMPEVGTRAHDVLLEVIEFVRREGRVDLSLRQLAEGAGTSHRMLGYYFGSREQLLGLVMRRLSAEYIAKFAGKRPTTRVQVITGTWSAFKDPNNRLQTQLLFALAAAAAENPGIEIPALTSDLDNLVNALTAFGRAEGLDGQTAQQEARLIVATLLGLYLDYFIRRDDSYVEDSYHALVAWVERSSSAAS